MSDIVEAVARAQYHATPRNKPFDMLSAHKREIAMAEARAAIEAYEKANAASLEEYDEATVSDNSGNSYRVRFPKGQNFSVISVDKVRFREV